MEELEGRLVDLIDKLEAVAVKLAPETYALAVQSVFVDGLVQLCAVLFFLTIFAGCVCMFAYIIRHDEEGKHELVLIGWTFFVGVASIAIAAILTFAGNPWLQVFAPEAALVKQLIL